MVDRGSPANVVSIRSSGSSPPRQGEHPGRPPLPPGVRRRRWLWLVLMVAVFIWSGSELWSQSRRIEARESALAAKEKELSALKAEQASLKEEVQLLQAEEYLDELARKMGYKKPNEEVYEMTDLP